MYILIDIRVYLHMYSCTYVCVLNITKLNMDHPSKHNLHIRPDIQEKGRPDQYTIKQGLSANSFGEEVAKTRKLQRQTSAASAASASSCGGGQAEADACLPLAKRMRVG